LKPFHSDRPADRSTARVVVVEDNAGDAYLIRHALARSLPPASRVVVIDTGSAALRYFERVGRGEDEAPSAIVLDVNLPGLSGIEVLRRLRERRLCDAVPIVVFTSSERDEDTSATQALSIAAYVVKPFDPDGFLRLGELVSSLLEQQDRN
jgi:two-component system response regulator